MNRLADLGHDVLAVDHDVAVAEVTQSGVQCRTVFAAVDGFAIEHGSDFRWQVLLTGKAEQQRHSVFGDAVFGVVEGKACRFKLEGVKAVGVFVKPVTHVVITDAAVVFLKVFPRC